MHSHHGQKPQISLLPNLGQRPSAESIAAQLKDQTDCRHCEAWRDTLKHQCDTSAVPSNSELPQRPVVPSVIHSLTRSCYDCLWQSALSALGSSWQAAPSQCPIEASLLLPMPFSEYV